MSDDLISWDAPPVDPLPDLDIPSVDSRSLEDLAARYLAPADLVVPRGKGRRPPRWDDPRILTMLGNLEIGAYRGEAITAAGLAERTVMRWLEIGRAEEEADELRELPPTFYRHMWQAVVRAETVPMMRALNTINRAGERGGWRASAWFLERRYPDEWGPKATAWKREEEERRAWEQDWDSPPSVSVEDLEVKVLRILGQRGA